MLACVSQAVAFALWSLVAAIVIGAVTVGPQKLYWVSSAFLSVPLCALAFCASPAWLVPADEVRTPAVCGVLGAPSPLPACATDLRP
jgi:hypothetical protein